MQNAFPGHHFSHQTAAFFHALIDYTPKDIFIRNELSRHLENEDEIEQETIDRVFKGKARVSKTFCTVQADNITHRVYSLYCKKVNNLGIIELTLSDGTKVRATDLERTLIDVTIRTSYSGGLTEVLKIYRSAAPLISVDKIIVYLRKLNFKYPYHQSIGFLMEVAGNFPENCIKQIKEFPININFYLDYGIKEIEFSSEWKLYYPKYLKSIIA